MRKFTKILLITTLAILSALFIFAACGKDDKFDSDGNAYITNEWEFVKIVRHSDNDWIVTRDEWLLDSTIDAPLPEFRVSEDGKTCTLQFNSKDHPANINELGDGSYELSNSNGEVWGHITIEGKVMNLEAGENVMTLTFEVAGEE